MARKFTDVVDAKILEPKKPAGCISGIFQLFGCQQIFHGRQLSEQANRRDASAHDPVSPSIRPSCNLEKNQSRRSQDNTRYSMESSRTSFTSTFTSFSSLEHKSPQEEYINAQHTFLSGRSPRNSPRTRSTDTNKSPDFKEVIRESIYKDLCSPKTKEDDNKRNKVFNSIHSSRPIEPSKDRDLNESLRLVLKPKVPPERFYEGRSPRFSYDGTEMSRILIDMKEYGNKHNGLSRLSMDSRECSLRCNLSPKINSAVKESDTIANKRAPVTFNQIQVMESNEKNSSIVAKIMGLEPLNSAIRCYDPNNKQNQVAAHEKTLRSPRNIAKSPRRNNPHLDLPSKFSNEETPQILVGNVEEKMNQKAESVFKKAEKRLENLPCQHSHKELQDIKRVIPATKNNGSMKLSSFNSQSIQFTPSNYRTNELSIKDLKCPIVIMEPARKLDATFSKVIKLEGHPGFGKIRTGDSRNNRKKDFWKKETKADQSSTEKKAKCRGPHPLSKESNERPVINVVSPRMQHMKPDLKIKATAIIPSYDLSKSLRQPEKSQLLDSISPRCKLRKKLNKLKDIELHNSVEQVNVGVNNCIEGKAKSPLLQKSIQSATVKVGTGAALVSALVSEAEHPVILKNISTKEFNLVSSRRSCPNSLSDALLNQDGLLHSPVSVSTIFKAEYQNVPSDGNFTMECHPPTTPFSKSSRADSAISESKDTAIQGSGDKGTTFNEAHIANAMFSPENQDNDRIVMAEKFQFSGLLQKESDLHSILEQKNCYKSSEFVQNTNPQKLHQKLFLDAMNEILAQKIDVASSGCPFEQMLNSGSFNIKHLYKELCSEIKCLRSCKDGNMDYNSTIHKDLIWNLQRWDSIKSELPMLNVEIERLIFKDLMNEVINGFTAIALDAKERRKRQVCEKGM